MEKYFCYYNLHKHVFSLKNKKTGLVEKDKYSNNVAMIDCIFKVSEKGRQRVLKEQRKNVHAGVEGGLIPFCPILHSVSNLKEKFTELTYNPYLYDSFVVLESEKPVESAEYVILKDKRVFAYGITLKDNK